MHYYQFNIADYRKDTQHLAPIEHYIYRELMDWYYLDEAPIPKKTQLVIRRLRLVSENNQDLMNVLEEFFQETDEGWIHGRITKEISGYHAKADIARANGSKGGRPKKPKKTQPVNSANPEITGSKANHKPLTINQEPINKTLMSDSGESAQHDDEAEDLKIPPCPVQQIVDLYHKTLPELPAVQVLSEKRRSQVKARWRESDTLKTLDGWIRYFQFVRESDFLMGRVDPSPGRPHFVANLEWLTKSTNFINIVEGKYHDKAA